MAVMPATLAILSIVFVESAYSAAGVVDAADALSHKLLSVLVLLVVSAANSISTSASTRLNGFFVVLKFISILVVVTAAVAVVGLHFAQPDRHVGGGDWHERSWFGYRKSRNPDGSETDWKGLGQWEIFGHYSAALYAALWAYSGWDKVRTRPIHRWEFVANLKPGHLRLGGTVAAGKAASTRHQRFAPDDHSLFPCGECWILHPPSVGCRIDD